MVLVDDVYFRLSVDPDIRLIRYVRTGVPLPTAEAYEAVLAAVLRALAPLALKRYIVLVDLRAAQGRNDPRAEAVAARFRAEVMGRCARAAVLMQTRVGALQAARHANEDRREPAVFQDEQLALAWLLER
jgi:hypothetical protein